jgi:hypothetical protein
MSALRGKADMDGYHLAARAKYDKYRDLYCQKLKHYGGNKQTLLRAFEISHECCHWDRVGSRSGFGCCLFVDSAAAPTAKRFHHSFRFNCSTAKKSCNAECK